MKPHHWRLIGLTGFVATVSILSSLGLELAAARYPQLGLLRFTQFTHGSATQGAN